MSDEPDDDQTPAERAFDPEQRVIQTANDLRSHAELAAVYEGVRKFDAAVRPGLDADVARDVQRTVATLDKARDGNNPLIPEPAEGRRLLALPGTLGLSTNDYHVHRRPGEVMIVRWLAGDEVDSFYERLQAHFDAGLAGTREQLRQDSWKQDEAAEKYLAALDALDIQLADRHLRGLVREHDLTALSTQTADEINIVFLADHLMGVPVETLVGPANAPPEPDSPGEPPAEKDLAWFFKLFLLRGATAGEERACFFTFLQKTDDDAW